MAEGGEGRGCERSERKRGRLFGRERERSGRERERSERKRRRKIGRERESLFGREREIFFGRSPATPASSARTKE